MSTRSLSAIIVLSLVGVGLSLFSLLHHASLVPGTFCDLSTTFNCDIVNRGPFSEIVGIPVALLGLIGYGFLLVDTALCLQHPEDRGLRLFLQIAAGSGFLFSLYLTGIEAFILHVWCPVCLTSQVVILGILILSLNKPARLNLP